MPLKIASIAGLRGGQPTGDAPLPGIVQSPPVVARPPPPSTAAAPDVLYNIAPPATLGVQPPISYLPEAPPTRGASLVSVAAARPPPIALPGGRSKDYIVVDASPPRPAPRASTEAVTPARRRSSGAAKGVTQADVAGSTPPGQKPKLQPPMSLKKARLSSFAAAPGPAEAAAEDRILPDDPRSSADGPRQTLVHSTYGDGLEVAPRAVRASLIRKADLSSAAGDMLAVRPDMKKSRNKWVIDPRAAYMRKWDIVIITLLMFTSIVTPFEARSAPRLPLPPLRGSPLTAPHASPQVAFLTPTFDALFYINRLVDFLFITDMGFQFFLAFWDTQHGQYNFKLRDIVRSYLQSWCASAAAQPTASSAMHVAPRPAR